MAAERPVVGSRVGGIPDLIKNGENGLLVEPADVDRLSAAVKTLLADLEMRRDMGKKGKVMARDFGVEEMVSKIDALYSSLLGV